MKKHLLLASLLLFPACAAMQQQYVDTVCNDEGAYQQGFNDGSSSVGKMDSSFASMCPADQDKIRRAYREGFDKARAEKAAEPKPTEIHIVHENAPTPGRDGWECKEAYGKEACGYDCKSDFGTVKCARYRDHNCVSAYGVIKCGLHCRA